MASNIVRMSPSPMAAQPPQPAQQDWVWDGANWIWCGPPFPCPPTPPPCPPSGHPTPCPPWFPPPAGQAPWYPGANGGVSFSATPPVNPIRGNLWWDGTVLHLFDGAAWVDIGPQVAGAGGSKGVTDGSAASPGFVGEVIQLVASGTVTVIPPPGSAPTTFTALVLPPGDWSIQESVTMSDLTNGVYFDSMSFTTMNGTVQVGGFTLSGNFFTTAGGLIGGTFSAPLLPLSVGTSTTLSTSLSVIALGGGPSGSASYKATTTARRVR